MAIFVKSWQCRNAFPHDATIPVVWVIGKGEYSENCRKSKYSAK
jgi:hypothetical protein